MSHADSGAGGMTNGSSNVSSAHKKMRRKRKELDALVADDKLRRKSSSSRHDLLHSDSDDIEFSGRRADKNGLFGGVLGCLPSVCALAVLLVTAVGVAATLRLLMATRKDLDTLQMRLNAVEANGSELPAKFHESHVRLQQLEKNHTALWSTLSTINNNLEDITEKLNLLETNMKVLQDSLSGSPQLSSLPKDVATIQDSVAAFGSSLQDVQSAVKAVKEEQNVLQKQLQTTSSSLSVVKTDVGDLYNATLISEGGRDGSRASKAINVAFLDLSTRVVHLTSSVSKINDSLAKKLNGVDKSKVQRIDSFNASLSSLRGRVKAVESSCKNLENQNFPSKISNMTMDLFILKESSDSHYKLLQNLTQSLDVVRGVEKKLEGSQLQMATGVGRLQKQIQSLEKNVKLITSTTKGPYPQPANHNLVNKRAASNEGFSNHPRRKRSVP